MHPVSSTAVSATIPTATVPTATVRTPTFRTPVVRAPVVLVAPTRRSLPHPTDAVLGTAGLRLRPAG
ncbi:hypothetical protein NS330_01035 [Curtobacterium citreum]|nr:hypothetical protein NS330_01035 [Curtobacterium citreum]